MEGQQYSLVHHFLQIKNCTFKNSQVDRTIGVGGAIASIQNSSLDLSHSIFHSNRAHLAGAIDLEHSNTKISQWLLSW